MNQLQNNWAIKKYTIPITTFIVLLTIVVWTKSSEELVESVDPITIPAKPEKTYNQFVLVRTSYVGPNEDASGWGTMHARFRRGAFISLAEGYEIDPTSTTHSININVIEAGAESPVFRNAFKVWRDALRYYGMKDVLEKRITTVLEEDPEADVTALQTRLTTIKTTLEISE